MCNQDNFAFNKWGVVHYYGTIDPSSLSYSPALRQLEIQTGRTYELAVNYGQVLYMQYAGTSEPPDRPLADQVNDFFNGYMWGRVQVDNNCKVSSTGGHFYWIKYGAKLYVLPSTVPSESVLVLNIKEFLPGALGKFQSSLSYYMAKIAAKCSGYTITHYEYENGTLRIEMDKQGTPFIILLIPWILGILIAIGVAIVSYKWINKENNQVEVERESNDIKGDIADQMLKQGYTPEQIVEVLKGLGYSSGGGSNDSDSITSVIKWIVILIAVGIAAYFFLSLIQAGMSKKVVKRV